MATKTLNISKDRGKNRVSRNVSAVSGRIEKLQEGNYIDEDEMIGQIACQNLFRDQFLKSVTIHDRPRTDAII